MLHNSNEDWKVSYLILLEERCDFGSSAKLLSTDVPCESEGNFSLRFPELFLVVIVLNGHNNFLSHEVS